jgi:hypothetical protein
MENVVVVSIATCASTHTPYRHTLRCEPHSESAGRARHSPCLCVLIVVPQVLTGFNGTVFAYGQTGCGKSFTMEGEVQAHIATTTITTAHTTTTTTTTILCWQSHDVASRLE